MIANVACCLLQKSKSARRCELNGGRATDWQLYWSSHCSWTPSILLSWAAQKWEWARYSATCPATGHGRDERHGAADISCTGGSIKGWPAGFNTSTPTQRASPRLRAVTSAGSPPAPPPASPAPSVCRPTSPCDAIGLPWGPLEVGGAWRGGWLVQLLVQIQYLLF